MTDMTAPLPDATTAEPAATPRTDPTPEPTPVVPGGRRRERTMAFGRIASGIAAIGVKELRGRMRGRRAFIILTVYLLLLGGFALMVETIVERGFTTGFGNSSAFASAAIGQGIFAAMLMLMTLQVVFLAPSSTAGAISLEREKQTLDLLITTPIPSLAIIIGKLLSTLVYVFLLIAASIPLMAVVFVYGGVGPEAVLSGYLVLLVTALGFGSFGLFCSTLVKRTTAATAITIFGVLALTIGTTFILIFWTAMGSFDANGNRVGGPFGIRAPAVLGYVNPFLAQTDVLCDTGSSFGSSWCTVVDGLVPSQNGIIFANDGGGAIPVAVPAPEPGMIVDGKGEVVVVTDEAGRPVDVDQIAPNQPVAGERESLWPKHVVTWLILSFVFLVLSVQSVSPTRRWRPRRRPRLSRSAA
jgi:ABC-type transport system involved in multi-copper enzyme maturation permease subunit